MSKKKENSDKPQYGMLKCLGYFFSRAAKYRPETIVLLFFQILFNVSSAVFGFYMSPMILSKLENHSTAQELILTAAFFIGGCFVSDALVNYIGSFKSAYQIELRSRILQELSDKLATTSYCHCLDNKYLRAAERATGACGGNSSAAEATWHTLQNLCVNIAMFVFFTVMLTHVHPIVFAVTVV